MFKMTKLAAELRSGRVSSLVGALQRLAHETRPTDDETAEGWASELWVHYKFSEMSRQVPLIVALGDDQYAIRRLREIGRDLAVRAWGHQCGGGRLDRGEERASNFEELCQEAVDACALLVATYPWTGAQ